MAGSHNKPDWIFRLEGERGVSARAPVIADDRVHAVFTYARGGFFESLLACFDLASGAELWRVAIDHVLSEPVVDLDGRVFVSSFGGQVLAFDRSGKALWRGPEADSNLWTPTLASPSRLVAPEIAGGSRFTWCLELGTGREAWRFESGGHTRAVVAGGDRIIQITNIAGDDPTRPTNRLTALGLSDGAEVWSATISRYPGSLARLGDQVIVGARGALLAYDLASGKVTAELRRPDEADFGALSPLTEDVLAIADNQNVLSVVTLQAKRGLFRSGFAFAQRWQTQLSAPALGRPTIVSQDVAVLGADGAIFLYAIADGAAGARFQIAGVKGADAGGLASSGDFLAAGIGRVLAVFRTR